MPSEVGQLGNVVYEPPEVVTSVIQGVSTGPNGGLYFLSGIPFEIEARIHVNPTALSNGSRFWQNVGPALEDVVGADPFGVLNLATPRFDGARQTARAEAATADDPDNRPTNCLFTY